MPAFQNVRTEFDGSSSVPLRLYGDGADMGSLKNFELLSMQPVTNPLSSTLNSRVLFPGWALLFILKSLPRLAVWSTAQTDQAAHVFFVFCLLGSGHDPHSDA